MCKTSSRRASLIPPIHNIHYIMIIMWISFELVFVEALYTVAMYEKVGERRGKKTSSDLIRRPLETEINYSEKSLLSYEKKHMCGESDGKKFDCQVGN